MSTHMSTDEVTTESPFLWPALALLVIAIGCFTYFWDGHRNLFPYAVTNGPVVWPPPPEQKGGK